MIINLNVSGGQRLSLMASSAACSESLLWLPLCYVCAVETKTFARSSRQLAFLLILSQATFAIVYVERQTSVILLHRFFRATANTEHALLIQAVG